MPYVFPNWNPTIIESNSFGCLWFVGWLFTIGFMKLSFWQGVLAIIIWPYYIGRHFHRGHQ